MPPRAVRGGPGSGARLANRSALALGADYRWLLTDNSPSDGGTMRRLTTAVFVLLVLAFVLGTGFVLGLAAGRAEGTTAAPIGLASLLQRVAPSALAGASQRPAPPASVSPEFQDQFQIFWETWSLLDRDYFDRGALDSKKLTRGAIRGMLDALGDPHTVYLDPELSEVSDAELRGGFEG